MTLLNLDGPLLPTLLWLGVAWVGGTAAILGSLITVGSLLLWLVPPTQTKGKPHTASPSHWVGPLKILGFGLAIGLGGLALLLTVPFP